MNRRLMMAQRNQGFELVYNAASGVLPTEQGWDFDYLTYGNNAGGTQSMSGNLLNVNVKHPSEAVRYFIKEKPIAQNCEFSITVDNINNTNPWNRLGVLLTNGEKGIEIAFFPQDGGTLFLCNKVQSPTDLKYLGRFGVTKNFKLRARLENGVVSVWFNDELKATINNLYDVSELYTTGNGNGSFYLFEELVNSIAFAVYGIYGVSNITYKEW
mgnify:CR=1 FL=1